MLVRLYELLLRAVSSSGDSATDDDSVSLADAPVAVDADPVFVE